MAKHLVIVESPVTLVVTNTTASVLIARLSNLQSLASPNRMSATVASIKKYATVTAQKSAENA